MSNDLINKWLSDLGEIVDSVADILLGRFYFHRFMTIVGENPDIQENNFFIVWIWENYLFNAAVSVRRQVDKRKDSISLLNLLKGIKKHPRILSRKRYTSLFKGTALENDYHYINICFDKLVGEGKDYLDPTDIKNDIEHLSAELFPIREYVNNKVAHFNREKLDKLPTINKLYDCLDLLEKLVKKYYGILHADGISQLQPEPQLPWEEVLKIPWIQE